MLALGCSFDTGSATAVAEATGVPPGEGGSSGGGSTGMLDADPETTSPAPGTSTMPSGTTEAATTGPDRPSDATTGPDPETTTGGTADGDESSSTSTGDVERPADCSAPVVFSQTVDEAEVFEPMTLGTYLDVDYAYSDSLNAGAIRFTFEVECPSMYRMFARVRDDAPGVNNCCDPDSFEVEAPGQSGDWFYGCDTLQEPAGFSWQAVEFPNGTSCDDTELVLLDLSPGTHEITLRNRESNYFEARAGVAELVLTNDPGFTP